MSELREILLEDIEDLKNYRDTEPPSEKDPDILELAKNIEKAGGILQPILCRPHADPAKQKAGKVQLIFGHRRRIAGRLAGLARIPSLVKWVADEDILEVQVTENLQRKDVHPMDEAIAFRSLIRDKNYTVEEIAALFGKKPEFVTQRLKLCDLIPELQKHFKRNELTASQAFLVGRLKPEDQKTIDKEWSIEAFASASTADVADWIRQNITMQLKSAPFDKSDATLNPKAGPCTTCQKRSGCGSLLFEDLKDDDRCFDKACYNLKADAVFLLKLAEVIETKPNIKLISSDKVPREVSKIASDHKVKIYDSGAYQTFAYGKYRKRETGFYVDGWKRGQTETVYFEGTDKSSHKNTTKGGIPIKRTAADIDQEIKGIQERQKRALELDLNKVHIAVREALAKKTEIKKSGLKHQGAIDRGIMIFLLLDKAVGMGAERIIGKALTQLPEEPVPFKGAYQVDYFKKLAALSDDDIAFICRQACIDHWGSSNLQYGVGLGDNTIRLIAEYMGIDIAGIEAGQKQEAEKRIGRADKRIAALRLEKKELSKSAAKKGVADKKASAKPKKATKTKPGKKTGRSKAEAEDQEDMLDSGYDYTEEMTGMEEGDVE